MVEIFLDFLKFSFKSLVFYLITVGLRVDGFSLSSSSWTDISSISIILKFSSN